jgi:hypothetical protein
MAWELALVWSETADVLKQESCWAVINQTKNRGKLWAHGASPQGLRDSDEGLPRVRRVVAPKVAEIPPNQKNRTEVLCRKS